MYESILSHQAGKGASDIWREVPLSSGALAASSRVVAPGSGGADHPRLVAVGRYGGLAPGLAATVHQFNAIAPPNTMASTGTAANRMDQNLTSLLTMAFPLVGVQIEREPRYATHVTICPRLSVGPCRVKVSEFEVGLLSCL